mmetsp:Transcript_307/g.906  ORF Transcript_307/g.906 Transcript_307/m.906 type:complete len:345 (-) Transcript_307:101-1135(-)
MARQFRKIVCEKLGTEFRNVTRIVDAPIPELQPKQVLVKNIWAGINASDINFTAGRYMPGVQPPFDTGFESLGQVEAVGPDCTLKVGQPVAALSFGAFSEYQVHHQKAVIPMPAVDPKLVPLLVSGLTASIALEQVGEMKSGETVLVTAAAGATGLFAVQLAKLAGNRVIGTCSSDDKVEILKQMGCERAVNYKKESLKDVLRNEYPDGVDLVYESVGGEMFETCVNALAVRGRIIIIGFVSGYQDQTGWSGEGAKAPVGPPLAVKLLSKSCSLRGFFLNHYTKEFNRHAADLAALVQQGKLSSVVDPTPFVGLEAVADGVDHMYTGKNIGKVVVKLQDHSSRL